MKYKFLSYTQFLLTLKQSVPETLLYHFTIQPLFYCENIYYYCTSVSY